MKNYHVSVLINEVIENLRVKKDKKYIDATLGGGGYTKEILKKNGTVLGIDVDNDALEFVKENFKANIENKKLILAKGNFRNIDKLAFENGFEKADGIVFDLGVSMHQLKAEKRGFSFLSDEEIDMRMDQDLAVKAKDLLNVLTKRELYEIFKNFGEEELAWNVASAIVRRREIEKIETTKQLADIVAGVKRNKNLKIHPATKVFQALRIVVNDELYSLKEALPKAISLLNTKGRVLVVTFHSLEDEITKKIFEKAENEKKGKRINLKPINPSLDEIEKNRSSRSASLRIFEKI